MGQRGPVLGSVGRPGWGRTRGHPSGCPTASVDLVPSRIRRHVECSCGAGRLRYVGPGGHLCRRIHLRGSVQSGLSRECRDLGCHCRWTNRIGYRNRGYPNRSSPARARKVECPNRARDRGKSLPATCSGDRSERDVAEPGRCRKVAWGPGLDHSGLLAVIVGRTLGQRFRPHRLVAKADRVAMSSPMPCWGWRALDSQRPV